MVLRINLIDLALIDTMYNMTKEVVEQVGDDKQIDYKNLLKNTNTLVEWLSEETMLANTMSVFGNYGVTSITFADPDGTDKKTYHSNDVGNAEDLSTRLKLWRELEDKISELANA